MDAGGRFGVHSPVGWVWGSVLPLPAEPFLMNIFKDGNKIFLSVLLKKGECVCECRFLQSPEEGIKSGAGL